LDGAEISPKEAALLADIYMGKPGLCVVNIFGIHNVLRCGLSLPLLQQLVVLDLLLVLGIAVCQL